MLGGTLTAGGRPEGGFAVVARLPAPPLLAPLTNAPPRAAEGAVDG